MIYDKNSIIRRKQAEKKRWIDVTVQYSTVQYTTLHYLDATREVGRFHKEVQVEARQRALFIRVPPASEKLYLVRQDGSFRACGTKFSLHAVCANRAYSTLVCGNKVISFSGQWVIKSYLYNSFPRRDSNVL